MPDFAAEFAADFSQFNESCAGAEQALGDVVTESEQLSPNVEAQAAAAGRAIGEFGKAVFAAGQEYVTAYAEEEAATTRLITALKNQGTASDETITKYGEMAKQFQDTTRFADDAVVAAQTIFTTIGKVGPAQMAPAIQAAADLAAGMGIGIEEAARIMARGLGTGGESLGGLQKILGDTVEKGASAEQIFGAINAKFGGQAAADITTWAGQMELLGHKMDDGKVKVGEYLAAALSPLLAKFLELSPATQDVIAGTVGISGEIGGLALKFAGVVSTVTPVITMLTGAGGLAGAWTAVSSALAPMVPYLGPAGIIAAGIGAWAYVFKNADVFLWAFAETWKGVKNTISGAVDAILGIVQRLYDGLKTWLVDKITALADLAFLPVRKIVDAYQWMADKVVLHSIVPDMINAVGAQFDRLPATMVEPTQRAGEAAARAFQESMDAITEAWVLSPFNKMSHNTTMIETDSGGVARDLFGRPVTPGFLSGLEKTMGQHTGPQWTINVNGSVLSTEDQLARVMSDAMTNAFRRGGNMLPT